MRARLRVRDGHPGEERQGRVVLHLAVLDDPAVAVRGVLAQAHVGHHEQLAAGGADRAHGLLHDAVVRVALGAHGVLRRGQAEEDDPADPQPLDLLGLARRPRPPRGGSSREARGSRGGGPRRGPRRAGRSGWRGRASSRAPSRGAARSSAAAGGARREAHDKPILMTATGPRQLRCSGGGPPVPNAPHRPHRRRLVRLARRPRFPERAELGLGPWTPASGASCCRGSRRTAPPPVRGAASSSPPSTAGSALEAELSGPRRLAAEGRGANASGDGRRVPRLDRRRGLPRHRFRGRPWSSGRAPASRSSSGRNGSGKSSFAEGLEVLLTGDSLRWKERAAVWREGWRNLHHPVGVARRDVPRRGRARDRAWCRAGGSADAAFEAAEVPRRSSTASQSPTSSPSAGPRPCAPIGPSCPTTSWARSSTKGPRSSTTPSPRSSVSRTSSQALGALQEARRSREKALKDATEARGRLLERLRGVDDVRARRVVAALEGKEWDLGAVDEVLGGPASAGAGAGEVDVLRGIASLEPPDPARVAAAVAEMRGAAAAAAVRPGDGRGPLPRRGRAPRERPSSTTPPTATATARCAAARAPSTAPGARGSARPAARLREAAREADAVHERAEAARRRGRAWRP